MVYGSETFVFKGRYESAVMVWHCYLVSYLLLETELREVLLETECLVAKSTWCTAGPTDGDEMRFSKNTDCFAAERLPVADTRLGTIA